MTRLRQAIAATLIALLSGCGDKRVSVGVQHWLSCEDCLANELDSVAALGDRAVPLLGKALRGPRKDQVENIHRQAAASYAEIASSPGPPPTMTQTQYVAHFVANYVAVYQTRAAVALRRIGTPSARAALLLALQGDSIYREDVRGTLGSAFGVRITDSTGDGQTAVRDSFVAQPLVVVVRDSVGNPLGRIRVAFAVDSGGGTVVNALQLTSPLGVAATRWRLGPLDSANVVRAVAAGQAVRFFATGRAPGESYLVFRVQPARTTAGASIAPAVQIMAVDSSGATDVSFSGNVTLTITAGTGSLGATLSGPTTVAAVAGIATFPTLSIALPGVGYRLSASASGLAGVTSTHFDIVP